MNPLDPRSLQQSLTMRRIALNRARTFARIAIVIGVLWVILSVAIVLTSAGNFGLHLSQVILGALFLGTGIWRLIDARRQIRRFEEENGAGAGEQTPVR